MDRYLIITADDFGFSKERNEGVIDVAKISAVTSASLLLNCTGTDDAIHLFENHKLCSGLHLNLTEGHTLSKKAYSTLTDSGGEFWGKFELRKRLESGKIDPLEIQLEIQCQIDVFKEVMGKHPLYVDGHQHIHVHPAVAAIFSQTLKTNGIQVTRLPIELSMDQKQWVKPSVIPFYNKMMTDAENSKSIFDNCAVAAIFSQTLKTNGIQVTRLPIELSMDQKQWVKPSVIPFYNKMMTDAENSKSIFDNCGIRYTDAFVGLSTMGSDMTATRLQSSILEGFQDAETRYDHSTKTFVTCELMCHPGYATGKHSGGFDGCSDEFGCSKDREHEITVLSSKEMFEFYEKNNIHLVSHEILIDT